MKEWSEKAEKNINKWGLQDIETLTLAMMEELGELSQAILQAKHENGDPQRIEEELSDLAALCYQMQSAIEDDQHYIKLIK